MTREDIAKARLKGMEQYGQPKHVRNEKKYIPQEVNGAYCTHCGDKPYLVRTGSVGTEKEQCRECGKQAQGWYVLRTEYLRNT